MLAGFTLTACVGAETVSLIPADGTLDGWHADVPEHDGVTAPEPVFVVEDGELISRGRPGGHLITDAEHADYRLEVEYRFVDGPGNCGVLVHASTPRYLYGMFPQSIEVQMHSGNAGDFWCIGEDLRVPDEAARRGGGGLADWGGEAEQRRRVLNLTDGSERPVGAWNAMRIECFGDRVRVWVNGELVNDATACTARRGRIALQAEGVAVAFRRLDLTAIDALTPAEALPPVEAMTPTD